MKLFHARSPDRTGPSRLLGRRRRKPRNGCQAARLALCWLCATLWFLHFCPPRLFAADPPEVRLGSKAFPESRILGEMLTILTEFAGSPAKHVGGLGGTQIAWEALKAGEIDAYVDYTGTIRKEMFPKRDIATAAALEQALAEHGVRMSRPLGFANSYAIGMRKDVADKLGIRKISDLRKHPDLVFGFTAEFLDRNDGWPGLKAFYGLPQTQVKGLEHALAYAGLEAGSLQAIDLYTTDAKIRQLNIVALADDHKYFPGYEAVLLYRADLDKKAPAVLQKLLELEGHIHEPDMIAMNARVELDRVPEREAAADFLRQTGLISSVQREHVKVEGPGERMLRLTGEHLLLVGLSLLAAIVIGIPLGILASYQPQIGQAILTITGILLTVPSIALLLLLIPLLGIGAKPAMAALFLYSLLPIVRNTHTGLHEIPLPIRESAEALGLSPFARLWLIELPLASRTILAGIQTAAVINVGTAALGGLIGAGGYGEVIFMGLQKRDDALLLQGAVPTALLAILLQGLFELVGKVIVPKGLRLKAAE